ncbi:MAG: DNA mismatch repair endonuclease MutL [Bacteroidales bacterium]
MPDVIKLLPDSVANQIAAGEVIQRPASVVKELMENSVDSGAGNIRVIIKDSGKTLVQVIDDGAGMTETDARLSFERHATSKITSANDLFAIRTKGFRGEALASIAAVAMVELKTRRKEDEAGTLVVINGSKVEIQEPCSCPVGSSFSVKSLFYNIPARRKFLKADSTEFRHIIGEFQKIVLAHPSIKFSLFHNDNEIYNLHPGNTRQRIVAVFGKTINQDLINLDTMTSLVNISGFIGKPENARRSSGEQFFFVNDRFMKHPYFHRAVMEAYHNILPAEVLPSYFIFMEVDPSNIDVNIHPTKTEIKFEDDKSIWQILMASVREALGRFNIVPSIDFGNEHLVDIPVRSSFDTIPSAPEIKINAGFNPFESESAHVSRGYAPPFESARSTGWERLYGNQREEEKEEIAPLTGNENQRKILQVRNKYLICPVKSGLMVIDQKRAHERILYERYLSCLGNNKAITQTTMFPEVIEVSPADFGILTTIEADLVTLGFDIRHLGGYSVSINGYPDEAAGSDPRDIFRLILEEYKSQEGDPATGKHERVCSALARASAIPYGRSLTLAEMENLIDTLFACSAPNYSPTGKPVVSILTGDELDKRMK